MTAPTTPSELARRPAPVRMTYEEYLALDAEAGIAEWIDGEVTTSMPTEIHQTVVAFFDRVIGLFVEIRGLGKVHVAPRPMRARPGGPTREPDVFFVAKPHLDRLKEQILEGPADLVIEVVSDDSVGRDRGEKFYEYEEAGIYEYWIVDPRPGRQRADFFVIDDADKYRVAQVSPDGLYRSAAIEGLVLKVDRLWREKPDVIGALADTLTDEELLEAFRRARKEG